MEVADTLYLPAEAVDGWFRLLVAVVKGEEDDAARRDWLAWITNTFVPSQCGTKRNAGNRIGYFLSDEIRGTSVETIRNRKRKRKGQTKMLEEIANQSSALSAADVKYDAAIAQLYRSDGQPKYGAAEMKERTAVAGSVLAEAAREAKELAIQVRASLDGPGSRSGLIDPITSLKGEDLARATQLLVFVEKDMRVLSLPEIAQRIDAAVADNDKVLALLFVRQSEQMRKELARSDKPIPSGITSLVRAETAARAKFIPAKPVDKPEDIRNQASFLRAAANAAEAKAATVYVADGGRQVSLSNGEL